MQLEWDGKVGPATIVGAFGTLSVLVTLGIIWGATTSKIDNTATLALEAKAANVKLAEETVQRDQKLAQQSERLGKIETTLQFIIPTLERIETKLDGSKPKP